MKIHKKIKNWYTVNRKAYIFCYNFKVQEFEAEILGILVKKTIFGFHLMHKQYYFLLSPGQWECNVNILLWIMNSKVSIFWSSICYTRVSTSQGIIRQKMVGFGLDADPSEHLEYRPLFFGVTNQNIPELFCTSREVTKCSTALQKSNRSIYIAIWIWQVPGQKCTIQPWLNRSAISQTYGWPWSKHSYSKVYHGQTMIWPWLNMIPWLTFC